MRIGAMFVRALERGGKLAHVARVAVELQGSLALTGVGHGTVSASVLGLAGFAPDTACPDAAADALAQVRSDRRCHATRFVLASGNDADPRIDEARMNGMDRFLPKPFCADRLIRVLESVSGRL